MDDNIRSLTTGNGMKSVKVAINKLNAVLGLDQLFRYSQVKRVLEEIDGWVRRKLRCWSWR
ncbi:MAG: group II intron maturase-specific domain-containing protein [Sodalis sp. (in: enterobacteria)]